MLRICVLLTAVALAGCTKSSAIPLSANTVQITTSAAPACGVTGAQTVALRRAAIETINRGFDRFLIVGGGYQNNVRVMGYTPVQAHTYGTATVGSGMITGSSTTHYSGGAPVVGGTHDQGFVVQMFKDGDPAGANGVSARGTLGPKWKEAIQESAASTC